MKYCEYEMKRRLDEKKQKFIKLSSFAAALFLGCLILSFVFVNKNNDIVCFCGFFMFALIYFEYKVVTKYRPNIIFSKEIKGENIKEIEYLPNNVKIYSSKFAKINSYYKTAHSSAKYTPRNIKAKVYLKLDDENVREIDGLTKFHADFYEDGDILLKYAGTNYPIVVSRKTNKQPCPLCGKINSESLKKCERCALDIIKES